jgi:hypothetical protein
MGTYYPKGSHMSKKQFERSVCRKKR